MAGTRLYSQWYDATGNRWRLDIYDATYSSAEIAFTLRSPRLDYKGKGDEYPANIKGSELKWTVVITASNIQDCINDLVAADEERFLVKLSRWDSVAEDFLLYWAGIVVHDIVTIPDNYQPSVILTAVDGLARLKDKDFNSDTFASGGAGVAWNSHALHIQSLLSIPTAVFWDMTDVYWQSACKWGEQNAVASPGLPHTDFVLSSIYSHRNNWKKITSGQTEYYTRYEMLEYFCQLYNLQLSLSNGVWNLLQKDTYEDSTVDIVKYQKDGFIYDLVNTDLNVSADQANLARLTDADFEYSAPVHKVTRVYNFRNSGDTASQGSNLVAFDPGAYTVAVNTGGTYETLGDIPSGSIVQFNIKLQNIYDNVTGNPLETAGATAFDLGFLQYRIYFKLVGGLGTTYYATPGTGVLNNYIIWGTGATYVKFTSGLFATDSDANFPAHIEDEISINAPDGGELFVKVEAYIYGYDNSGSINYNNALLLGTNTLTEEITYLNIAVLNDSMANISGKITFSELNTVDNSVTVELPDTIMGDGYYSTNISRLQVWNGSALQNTAAWEIGGTGSTYNINDLLCLSVCDFLRNPQRKFLGQLIYKPGYEVDFISRVRLTVNGLFAYFWMNGAEYDLAAGTVDCEMWAIPQYSGIGLTASNAVLNNPDIGEVFQQEIVRANRGINLIHSPVTPYIIGDIVIYNSATGEKVGKCIETYSGAWDETKFQPVDNRTCPAAELTADTVIDEWDDSISVAPSGSDVTITLTRPAVPYHRWHITKTTATDNVIVDGDGTDISGNATVTLTRQYTSIQIEFKNGKYYMT